METRWLWRLRDAVFNSAKPCTISCEGGLQLGSTDSVRRSGHLVGKDWIRLGQAGWRGRYVGSCIGMPILSFAKRLANLGFVVLSSVSRLLIPDGLLFQALGS